MGGGELSAVERDSILNGSFAALTINILSTFAPLLLLDPLRGTAQQVALLNALPALVSIGGLLLAAVWLPHARSQRRAVVGTIAVARFLVVLLAVAIALPPAWAAWTTVGLYALANLPGSLANVGWQNLIAGLIPAERRATFFAERNRATTIAGMGITILAGLVLQAFPVTAKMPYQGAFRACALFAFFEIYFLLRHPDVTPPPSPRLWDDWRASWAVKPFRRYLLLAALYTFAWQSAWPLYSLFQIREAHATALWLALFTVASSATSILTYRWWGRTSVERGIAPMLVLAAWGLGVSPAVTVLFVNLPWLIATNLFTGMFLSGVTLLMFNMLLAVAPEPKRLPMIALYNLSLGIVGALAPEFGIAVLHWLHLRAAMVALAGFRVATATGFWLADERAAAKWAAWRAAHFRVGGRTLPF